MTALQMHKALLKPFVFYFCGRISSHKLPTLSDLIQ